MNDEELIGFAKAICWAAFKYTDIALPLLEPVPGGFDEDAACLAQQMVAEATGLVGLPEVYETHR